MKQFLLRFGQRLVIPRLALILTIGSSLCFIFAMISPEFLSFIVFVPSRVMQGEFWRLLSFIFYPFDMHPIFAFFTYYLFFLMGTALEHEWGAGRFNLFMLTGYAATVFAAFLFPDAPATNYYIYLSIYLAFAALHPDFELYLFFVLPVKIKWIAWTLAALILLDFYAAGVPVKCAILASAVNFAVFFGIGFFRTARGNIRAVQVEIRAAREEEKPFHLCAVCGMTEKKNPLMEFRVCPHCHGGREYCAEHLRDHAHLSS